MRISESSLINKHLNRKENPNNATWSDIENIKNNIPLLIPTLGVFKEFTKFKGNTNMGTIVTPEMLTGSNDKKIIIQPNLDTIHYDNPYKSLYLYIDTKIWDKNESFIPKNIKILTKGEVRIFFDGPILDGFTIEFLNGGNGEGYMYICPTDKQKVKNCNFRGAVIIGTVLSEELLRKNHIKISEDPTDIIFNISNLIVPTIEFEKISGKLDINSLKDKWKLSDKPGNIFEVIYNNSNKFEIGGSGNRSYMLLKSQWPYNFKELSDFNIMDILNKLKSDIIKLISQKPGLGYIKDIKNIKDVSIVNSRI